MADSENSRTLPSFLHGNLLSTAERFLEKIAAGEGDSDILDESLARWKTWWHAHLEYRQFCTIQQQMESKLFRMARTPSVEIRVPGQTRPAVASTAEEIDTWLQGDAFAEIRTSAKLELATRRRDWEAADAIVGYSRAKAAEDLASAIERRLSEDLWQQSVGSVVSAVAKLHCVITQGEPEPNSGEFPWPEVRSVLIDLLMVSVPARPAASG